MSISTISMEEYQALTPEDQIAYKNSLSGHKGAETRKRNKAFLLNHLFFFDSPPESVPQNSVKQLPNQLVLFDSTSLQNEILFDFDPRDEEAHIPEVRQAAGRTYNPWAVLPPSSSYNWEGYEEKLHDILLVRSVHTLMDRRCSQAIRDEITQWLNAPLIPEELIETEEALQLLPFSFQACCLFAEVNPIELIENLSFSLRMNHFPYEFDLLKKVL